MRLLTVAMFAGIVGYLTASFSDDLKPMISAGIGVSIGGLVFLNRRQERINQLLLEEIDRLKETR